MWNGHVDTSILNNLLVPFACNILLDGFALSAWFNMNDSACMWWVTIHLKNIIQSQFNGFTWVTIIFISEISCYVTLPPESIEK